MTDSNRATIAYIVGRIVRTNNCSAVYDYKKSRYINMSGKVSNNRINIYNYDKCCYFSGSRISSKYNIYNYGDSCYISLEIKGNKFSGYVIMVHLHILVEM